MPRALKLSAVPVEVVARGALQPAGLAQEYGVRVPMGANQQQLQVRRRRQEPGHAIL